jgi:hypothetical protein
MPQQPLQCPAAPQQWPDAVIFAVFAEGKTIPVQLEKVTPEWLALCAPQTPRQVLRMAATCVKSACLHWDATQPGATGDGACTLAQRVIAHFTPPTAAPYRLQPCAIRGSCRWWAQDGPSACQPCHYTPTDSGALPQDAESDADVPFF